MDLRHVDLHISKQKLTIKSAFFKSYFAFSFDLKAGYNHFDIFPNCHKYLAFRGILAQGMSDIFNLRFCLLCFLVHLLVS